MANLPKNQTNWVQVRPQGYSSVSTGADILTQAGKELLTQAGTPLTINGNTIMQEPDTAWTYTVKSNTPWTPVNEPYQVVVGTENIAANNGFLLVDNSGNFIVTTSTYQTGKNPTAWSETSAS